MLQIIFGLLQTAFMTKATLFKSLLLTFSISFNSGLMALDELPDAEIEGAAIATDDDKTLHILQPPIPDPNADAVVQARTDEEFQPDLPLGECSTQSNVNQDSSAGEIGSPLRANLAAAASASPVSGKLACEKLHYRSSRKTAALKHSPNRDALNEKKEKSRLAASLIHSVRTGAHEKIEALVRKGIPVDFAGAAGQTAIDWSIELGDHKTLELLLNEGCISAEEKTNAAEKQKKWIVYVVNAQNLKLLEVLLKKFPEGISFEAAKAALFNDRNDFLQTFLKKQKNLATDVDSDGKTLLYWAVSFEPRAASVASIQTLLAFGADPHFLPKNNRIVKMTPFDLARAKRREVLFSQMQKPTAKNSHR